METHKGRTVACALVISAVVGAAGCASQSGSSPQQTVRSSGATAPADLQLTCASEAATQLGADATKVLPLSSAAAGAGAYRVDLNVDGRQAVCTIGADGTVQSIEAVG